MLYARFDFLDVVGAVVALSDDDVEMVLACFLRVADPLGQDFLCFFYVLAVEVDRVGIDFPVGVVLAENKLRGF